MDSKEANEREKRRDIIEVVQLLEGLSPIQVEVLRSIIKRFADEQESELVRDDFLTQSAFEYFTMRLAAHHAYSSSVLKKENFEHILEQAFRRAGVPTVRANSMTVRGADLTVGGVKHTGRPDQLLVGRRHRARRYSLFLTDRIRK